MQALRWIQNRIWTKTKKCMIAAIYAAGVYHIWQARNWVKFRGTKVQNRNVIKQIQIVIRGSIGMIQNDKRIRRVRQFIHRLNSE